MLGGKVARILEEHSIYYDAIAVNREYYNKYNKDEVCLEDYLETHRCSLIVAFKGYNEAMLGKLKRSNIEEIYTLDFQGRYAASWDSKITDELFANNYELYEELYNRMEDDKSREALELFLKQKMQGFYAKEYSRERQYFEEGIVELDNNEVFVDCGGFDGSDTAEFLDRMGNGKGKAFVFEPDPENFKIVRKRFGYESRVRCINKGLDSARRELRFNSGKGQSSGICENGDAVIFVDAIDDALKGEQVTFIKMDIEGYELSALHGARETIARCHPKLAICVYHRAEDLFTIPQFILDVYSDYKLYFRSYHASSSEGVLYAV